MITVNMNTYNHDQDGYSYATRITEKKAVLPPMIIPMMMYTET